MSDSTGTSVAQLMILGQSEIKGSARLFPVLPITSSSHQSPDLCLTLLPFPRTTELSVSVKTLFVSAQ